MKSLLILSVFLAAFAAHADIRDIQKTFNQCAQNAMTTSEQERCAGQAFRDADTELNRVYNQIKTPLLKSNDKDEKEILRRLVASERAWLPYRDADCELTGTEMLGGSGEGVVVGTCRATLTIKRVKSLYQIFGESLRSKADDQCFVSYSQAAGRCNTAAGNDEGKFAECLAPVKAALKTCCEEPGTTPACGN